MENACERSLANGIKRLEIAATTQRESFDAAMEMLSKGPVD